MALEPPRQFSLHLKSTRRDSLLSQLKSLPCLGCNWLRVRPFFSRTSRSPSMPNPKIAKKPRRPSKTYARRSRVTSRELNDMGLTWVMTCPVDGYIRHPEAKWLMHPSFFDPIQRLCSSSMSCTHYRSCGETRAIMAALSYIRNERVVSYRDLEALWGVSRSTIQRKKKKLENQSTDLFPIILHDSWVGEGTTRGGLHFFNFSYNMIQVGYCPQNSIYQK